MKLENTAPFGDEFVTMTDTLTEALRAAEDTLETAEASEAEQAEPQLVSETEDTTPNE